MNVCCVESNYKYVEVSFKDGTKHVKCVCKCCDSYIGFVKKERIDEMSILKKKSKNLF